MLPIPRLNNLIFLLIILLCKNIVANENIGVIEGLEKKSTNNAKHNIIEVLESFDRNPMIIDYLSIVNWSEIQNLSSDKIDDIVYHSLKKFLRKNHIKKIVLGGDNYNYNTEPYHPMPQARKFFTKAISRMEREGRVKVLGICGGMQGILYFNDIALDTVSSMIGKIKAEKYKSAYPFLSNDHYINQTKKFYSCQAKLNKIFISQRSRIGNLMIKAEKKYGIKYDRNREEDLIVEVPFAHGNAVSSFDRINLDKLKSSDFNVVGLSEDRIIYVVENKKNGDILIQGHPELIANTNHCGKSFADRNAIFGRLLFYNLLQNQLKSKLPNHLLTFAE